MRVVAVLCRFDHFLAALDAALEHGGIGNAGVHLRARRSDGVYGAKFHFGFTVLIVALSSWRRGIRRPNSRSRRFSSRFILRRRADVASSWPSMGRTPWIK